MKPLEIISYNIQFGKNFDDVMAWIEQAEISPDIFCFQEFPKDKIPYFEGFLKKRGYSFAYTPGIELRGRKLGELTAHKTASLQLLSQKELQLGKYKWERGDGRVQGQRSAQITAYRGNGVYFSIANVHLSNLSPHSMRFQQLQMVIEELKLLSENAIIIGDFNYSSLFGVKRLFQFMESFGFTCVDKRLITHKLLRHIPQQLDYVFQKGFVLQEIAVLKVPHSDHLPVAVTVSLE